MAKKSESRKVKRARAARERSREEHARLVVERQGDSRYVLQTHTPTGRTIHLRPEDRLMVDEQIQRFRDKFGREPGDEDPLFFDPDKDEPTPLDEAAEDKMFDELRAASIEAGLDPAYIDAWREVGYMITDENRHLFSAHEVEAYLDAVASAQARLEE